MTSGNDPDDFEFITMMQNAKTRAEDFQRLQDSIAGRETGHGNKHHRQDSDKTSSRMAREKAGMSTFDILMSDPSYAALRASAFDLLEEAETLVESALQRAQAELATSLERLENLRDNANRLPDGRKVYRDKQGNVRTKDGAIVTGPEVDGLIWNNDHTSYEAVKAEAEANATAKAQVDDHAQKQIDFGETRNRMEDKDDPMTHKEYEEVERELQDIIKDTQNMTTSEPTQDEQITTLSSDIDLSGITFS
jgi:hypothetical protein